MMSRRSILLRLTLVVPAVLLSSSLLAQDSPTKHGRKYKPPPATSHIEVQVTKHFNGKPIMNAAVVFNPSTKDGKDLGSLEVKTDPDGKASVDIIPTGSLVRVQVIANGFATYAEDFEIDEPSREIAVALLRPQEQVSSYEDNTGKFSSRKPGVQEPDRPTTPAPAAQPANNSSAPASTTTTTTQPASTAPKQQ